MYPPSNADHTRGRTVIHSARGRPPTAEHVRLDEAEALLRIGDGYTKLQQQVFIDLHEPDPTKRCFTAQELEEAERVVERDLGERYVYYREHALLAHSLTIKLAAILKAKRATAAESAKRRARRSQARLAAFEQRSFERWVRAFERWVRV